MARKPEDPSPTKWPPPRGPRDLRTGEWPAWAARNLQSSKLDDAEREVVASWRALATELADERDRRRWGLRRLAAEAGVSFSVVTAAEAGSAWPRLGTVEAIAGALGFTLEVEGEPGHHVVEGVMRQIQKQLRDPKGGLTPRQVAEFAGVRPNTLYELPRTVAGGSVRTLLSLTCQLNKVNVLLVPMASCSRAPSDETLAAVKKAVFADAGTIQTLLDGPKFANIKREVEDKTAQQVLDSLTKRLQVRIDGKTGDHNVWKSLAERLNNLRQRAMSQPRVALDWLRDLLVAARDLALTEKVEDERGRAGLDALPPLTDPNVGALSQIFVEYAPKNTPVLMGRIVEQVDAIAKQVCHPGWVSKQSSRRDVRIALRKTLKQNGLEHDGDLFDRAYAYIELHY